MKCNSIHTFFMRQPIDICITDKNNKILYLQENFKPNKILFIRDGYYTYELPIDTVKHLKIDETLKLYEEEFLK